jgi:hypothetical protein
MEEDEGIFVFDVENLDANPVAVLYYDCPECGIKTRFTAQDERSDGSLVCPGPGCGSVIHLDGDGLKGSQRKLDDGEKALADILDKL